MRKKLKAVRQKIVSYKYRRRDGQTVVVPSHFRTYYKRAIGGAKKGAKKVAKHPITISLAGGLLTDLLLIEHLKKKRLIYPQEAKELQKKIGVKSDVEIVKGKEGIFSADDSVIFRPRNIFALFRGELTPIVSIEHIRGRLPSSTLAHELGHVRMHEEALAKRAPIKYFLIEKLKGAHRRGRFLIPVIIRDPKKRRLLLVASWTPDIMKEAKASYYGYKGLKRMYGRVRPSEVAPLIGSPLDRVAILLFQEGIGKSIDDLVMTVKRKRKKIKEGK